MLQGFAGGSSTLLVKQCESSLHTTHVHASLMRALQIDSEAVKQEQQEALDRVTAAVIAAQEILAGGTLQSGKRKASMQVSTQPAKRARIFGLEELSDSETDSEDDEEIAMFEKAGQLAAAGSSGLDSSVSDYEAAPALGQTSSAAGIATLESTAQHLQTAKSKQHSTSTVEARGASELALSKELQSGAGTASSSQANAAVLESANARQNAATPPQAASHSTSLMPHKERVDLSASSTQQPTAASPSAATPAAVASSRESQQPSLPVKPGVGKSALDKEVQQQKPIDLAQFDSAEQLEAVGMDALKAELQRHGMKCGGTASERAARLLLLKDRNVKDLDRKHLAK